jgi:hypothetical protein
MDRLKAEGGMSMRLGDGVVGGPDDELVVVGAQGGTLLVARV